MIEIQKQSAKRTFSRGRTLAKLRQPLCESMSGAIEMTNAGRSISRGGIGYLFDSAHQHAYPIRARIKHSVPSIGVATARRHLFPDYVP